MKPFTQPVRPEDVGELIDLTVVGDLETRSMADMQLEGIAAIYDILCEHRFAYLADEVGMGKTYQAMGLAALVWNEKPGARILFISPRQNLQVKWYDDYRRFFASNYRRRQGLGDDRAASVLFGQPVHRPVLFHNLRSWTPTIGMPGRIAPFVRHTSFTRPVYVTSRDLGDMDALWNRTNQQLRSWGLFGAERPQGLSAGTASEQLNLAFAEALNAKLTEEAGEQSYFDLVIVDEAQCLRNPTNQTNRVLFAALQGHVNRWLFMSATPAHLYFADEQTEHDADALPLHFLDWLSSDDPGARQVRHDCTQWLAHLRLIVDGCLEGAGRRWRELAREESWPQLYNPMAVIGVTGGSGAHRTATRQFRTPSLPRVIVCTDTLKEGVDLHLFCDRVLHYGVAWTSGDLEQRVGRVDRFFSQIERRLIAEGAPPDVELHVGYPHVVASLERGQVERVIERQKRAELLMDSPLAGARHEGKDMVVGAGAPRELERTLEPYRPSHFSGKGRPVVAVSKQTARAIADHYARWYARLSEVLAEHGWRISPGDQSPVRVATLYGKSEQHDLEWTFDAALSRYVLTLSDVPWDNDAVFSGGMRRRRVGRSRRIESFLRLLVPTPDEGADGTSIARLVAALEGQSPRADANAPALWGRPLAALANGGVEWLSDHKARIVVPRGERTQGITLYAYQGGVRLVSVVAPLDELEHRGGWGGAPTAEHVRDWALDTTNDLTLGYLDVHERDGLVFGNHILHGELSESARRRLVEEVAWRADAWEAALTGADRR